MYVCVRCIVVCGHVCIGCFVCACVRINKCMCVFVYVVLYSWVCAIGCARMVVWLIMLVFVVLLGIVWY